MRASGICGSDLNLYRRESRPSEEKELVVCGHEPCGEVVERGPGVSEQQAPTGQRVMIHHYRGCNACWLCRMGYTQMCEQTEIMGTDMHGGNAPYLLAPASTLVPLPDELSFAEGAAIACGTGTAYAALKRLDVSGRDTLAIFGQGPVGLAATQLAVAMGARVIAVELSEERRAMARELGAEVTIDPSADAAGRSNSDADARRGRGRHARLQWPSRGARQLRARRAAVGQSLLRRRARHGHVRDDTRRDPPPAHHDRLVDVQSAAHGRVRALRRRSQRSS